MKIKSNRKNENSDKNSYNTIYQKIKEEIKSIVITRLLNQIQNMNKKYEKLKKEYSIIKNDLIYILKRILTNKNEYININENNTSNLAKNYQPKNIYSINGVKSSSYLYSKSYNSFLSSTEKINNDSMSNYNQLYYNNYTRNTNSINKQMEKRRYSIDDDNKKGNNSSYSHLENSLQFNIQNKIDYYLNSLYKHNFSEECATGTSSVHLLNKNQSIYDELFSNKNNRFKSLSPINTDINFKKVSQQKDRKNLYNNNDNESKIKNRNHNMQKNQSNYLKVHRRGNIDKSNSKLKINGYNKQKYGSKSSSNMIYNSNSKNHNYISGNHTRSRFLVNKF